jgi:hypothetical protein
MKTNALTWIYALAMSAVFATVATIGVAVVMASSGEHASTQFDVAAQQTSTSWRMTRRPGKVRPCNANPTGYSRLIFTSKLKGPPPL